MREEKRVAMIVKNDCNITIREVQDIIKVSERSEG